MSIWDLILWAVIFYFGWYCGEHAKQYWNAIKPKVDAMVERSFDKAHDIAFQKDDKV